MDGASGFHGFQGLPTSNTATGAAGNLNSADGSTGPNSNGGGSGGGSTQQQQQCTVREQDRFMPIANVIRIMRKVLPSHAKISDDAKETIQECVSEYISFITSEANDRCQREQRKTITAEDVLWAMSKLGFDNYIDPLAVFLHRYRDLEGDHRGSIRGEPLPFKRSASAANMQPVAAPPPPLPMPNSGGVDAYGVIPALSPMTFRHHHHHHQFGVYGEHVMGGYYLGMSTYAAAGDGGVAGTSHSQPQHPTAAAAAAAAAFDPYAAYK